MGWGVGRGGEEREEFCCKPGRPYFPSDLPTLAHIHRRIFSYQVQSACQVFSLKHFSRGLQWKGLASHPSWTHLKVLIQLTLKHGLSLNSGCVKVKKACKMGVQLAQLRSPTGSASGLTLLWSAADRDVCKGHHHILPLCTPSAETEMSTCPAFLRELVQNLRG